MPKLKSAFKKEAHKTAQKSRSALNLLLLSNGALVDKPTRDAAVAEVFAATPETPKTVLYIGYARGDEMVVIERIKTWLAPFGISIISAQNQKNPVAALSKVDGVFVDGGNTFRLLDKLQKTGLLEAVRDRVLAGMPYMGASAGINVTGPTIMTTNDMPIVQPRDFNAMGLVPFQINPHYVDGKFYYEEEGNVVPYQGESRADRLNQYHEENRTPIVGVREGSALRVRGMQVEILGGKPVTLFEKGKPNAEISDSKVITALMHGDTKPFVGRKSAPRRKL
jgi:dipeptidase E